MKRIFSLVLIFALCLPLTACGLKTKYTKTVMNCFDTVTTIVGYAMNEKTFLTVADEIS